MKAAKNISRSFHVLGEDSEDFFKGASEGLWDKTLVWEKTMQLKPRCFCEYEVRFYTKNHEVLGFIS